MLTSLQNRILTKNEIFTVLARHSTSESQVQCRFFTPLYLKKAPRSFETSGNTDPAAHQRCEVSNTRTELAYVETHLFVQVRMRRPSTFTGSTPGFGWCCNQQNAELAAVEVRQSRVRSSDMEAGISYSRASCRYKMRPSAPASYEFCVAFSDWPDAGAGKLKSVIRSLPE